VLIRQLMTAPDVALIAEEHLDDDGSERLAEALEAEARKLRAQMPDYDTDSTTEETDQ